MYYNIKVNEIHTNLQFKQMVHSQQSMAFLDLYLHLHWTFIQHHTDREVDILRQTSLAVLTFIRDKLYSLSLPVVDDVDGLVAFKFFIIITYFLCIYFITVMWIYSIVVGVRVFFVPNFTVSFIK